MPQFQPNALTLVLTLASALCVSSVSSAPIVQPGAPGETGQVLSAEEAVRITDTSYSPADTHFMQMMIPHHAQALEMAQLVEVRTNRPELVDIAGRIKSSQSDEIDFMQSWLTDRGEAPMAHASTWNVSACQRTYGQMEHAASASFLRRWPNGTTR